MQPEKMCHFENYSNTFMHFGNHYNNFTVTHERFSEHSIQKAYNTNINNNAEMSVRCPVCATDGGCNMENLNTVNPIPPTAPQKVPDIMINPSISEKTIANVTEVINLSPEKVNNNADMNSPRKSMDAVSSNNSSSSEMTNSSVSTGLSLKALNSVLWTASSAQPTSFPKVVNGNINSPRRPVDVVSSGNNSSSVAVNSSANAGSSLKALNSVLWAASSVQSASFPKIVSVYSDNSDIDSSEKAINYVLNAPINSNVYEKTFSKSDVSNKMLTNVTMHINPVSGRLKTKHVCDICKKCFRHKNNLRIHNLIHTGEKPHVCHVCRRGFSQKIALQKHILIHTGEKPHECNVCKRGFTTKGNLQKHCLTHTGEKPHICNMCNRGFTQKIALKKHIMTHTGEKPFICNFCDKRFTTKGNLKIHCRVHDANKKVNKHCQTTEPIITLAT